MAKLERLQDFDKSLALCRAKLSKIAKQITPISHPDPQQQAEQQSDLTDAVLHLANAVSYLVHHNR